MKRCLLEYLVNSAWQVPMVAAAAWLGLRVGRPSMRVQHAVWLLAMVGAVLLPAIPQWHGAREPVRPTSEMPMATSLREATGAGNAGRNSNPRAVEGPAVAEPRKRPPVRHLWQLSTSVTQRVAEVYLAVIALALLRLLLSCVAARRLVRKATPAELSALEVARLRQCCTELGVEVPQIRSSAQTWSPVVVGALRPVIVLPQGYAGLADAAEMEAVWWHELAHVSRRDYLANLLWRIWMLPIVYHPAAHLVARQVGRTREMVCDAVAANKMSSRVAYARCLAEMASRTRVEGAARVEGTAMFCNGALEERVMELLRQGETVNRGVRMVGGAVGALSFAGVLGTAVLLHVTPTLAEGKGAVQTTAASGAQSPAPVAQERVDRETSNVQRGVADAVRKADEPNTIKARRKYDGAWAKEQMQLGQADALHSTEVERLVAAAKSERPMAGPQSDHSSRDAELYERAMGAKASGSYEVERMVLQTLINTYPNSEYVAPAKRAIGRVGMRRVRWRWCMRRLSTRPRVWNRRSWATAFRRRC